MRFKGNVARHAPPGKVQNVRRIYANVNGQLAPVSEVQRKSLCPHMLRPKINSSELPVADGLTLHLSQGCRVSALGISARLSPHLSL
jgi:hypothetical protein